MKIRLMPGQVVIREETPEASAVLWTPTPGARETHTHTGRVLAHGPPARVNGTGAEVPHGFTVGDLVQYHFTSHEGVATNVWPLDGKVAVWLPQENVDGVWSRVLFCGACRRDVPYGGHLCTHGEEHLAECECGATHEPHCKQVNP